MRAFGVYACLLIPIAAGAMAQPLLPGGGRISVAASESEAPDGRKPSDYLRTAQTALAAGRSREATEALEMAQTRLLDRSVPLGQTNQPSDDLAAVQIVQARQALRSGDRNACKEFIQSAIAAATAQGL